jgi:hypothetical protein
MLFSLDFSARYQAVHVSELRVPTGRSFMSEQPPEIKRFSSMARRMPYQGNDQHKRRHFPPGSGHG